MMLGLIVTGAALFAAGFSFCRYLKQRKEQRKFWAPFKSRRDALRPNKR